MNEEEEENYKRSEMKEVKRGKVYLSNNERVLVGEKRVLEVEGGVVEGESD